MIAKDRRGSVELIDGKLILRPIGMFGRKKTEQVLQVRSVNEVHFRKAGFRPGFIYFETGSLPLGQTPSGEASEGRKGLQFSQEKQSEFEQIRDEIMKLMGN